MVLLVNSDAKEVFIISIETFIEARAEGDIPALAFLFSPML